MAADRTELVALASELADLARPILLRHYRQAATAVDTKRDLSPVTIADRDAEAAMRKAIADRFPDHGIIGEEYGPERADAEFVWVLDPIDGTKSFIAGKPLFGTLIACAEAGQPVVGVIDMPALSERWIGADDRPTTMTTAATAGQTMRTRPCKRLSSALMHATSPAMFKGGDADRFAAIAASVRHPIYGSDCYGYAMVSGGWSDLVIEASLQVYDFAACVPVVTGAGGVMAGWDGRPLRIDSPGRVIACGDPALLPSVLRVVG
jgi:inositol-phosphate phosphatase / L-galactose 1-phosphate phosphatase / histidinol-phosphatase